MNEAVITTLAREPSIRTSCKTKEQIMQMVLFEEIQVRPNCLPVQNIKTFQNYCCIQEINFRWRRKSSLPRCSEIKVETESVSSTEVISSV